MKNSTLTIRETIQTTIAQPPKQRSALSTQNANTTLQPTTKGRTQSRKKPPQPVPKVEYNIENNMTTSKLIQAKQGLTLLKRKMSTRAMSRQKMLPTVNQPSKVRQIPQKKTEQEVKPSTAEVKSRAKTGQSRPVTQSQPRKNKPPQPVKPPQFEEEDDNRPISKAADFMALLEREMQKEGRGKGPMAMVEEEVLEMCSRGCGKTFHPSALPTHEKVCRQVFLSKRKVFNTAVQRLVEGQTYKPPGRQPKAATTKQKKQSGVASWKVQSAELRAGLKMARNRPLNQEEQQLMQVQKNVLVGCKFCGRNFSEEAAARHIPFCEKKAKQMKPAGRRR